LFESVRIVVGLASGYSEITKMAGGIDRQLQTNPDVVPNREFLAKLACLKIYCETVVQSHSQGNVV
jgi:hypothetical protein